MAEWIVLEYMNSPGLRFYTRDMVINPKFFKKVGETDTREEAVELCWKDNFNPLKPE
ncbi:MAG TPA: hypothetical protein PLE74_07670 [Candidatus Cloacimonadota bacterium]|nr:hypothetical protein [Candidatus Cloacimonadota bacterium]